MEKLKNIYSDLVDREPIYQDKAKKYPVTEYLRLDKNAQKAWDEHHDKYEDLTNELFLGNDHYIIPWWNKYPGQAARLILVIHIIRQMSGETSSRDIDAVSVNRGIRLGRFFLATAYRTISQRKGNNGSIIHQREYAKIVRWVKSHKEPMEVRKMQRNRVFGDAPSARDMLDEWVDAGLGIYADKDKNRFVPLNYQ